MKRALTTLAVLLLAVLAAGAAEPKDKNKLPAPARAGGYFQRGGADIGRGYGYGGQELGRGAGGFGKNLAGGEFGESGRSFGRGAAEFGKGVGIGTARGFKNFGLAFRHWGKKVDRSASDDQSDQQSQSESQ